MNDLSDAVYRLEHAVTALYRALDICALRGKPPTAAMVDRWTRRLRDECGLEVG